MRIRIEMDGSAVNGAFDNNPTARDFASLLPLRVTLTDYASTEKVSGLPRKLSTERAPPGFEPAAGDIAYYAPWGNLALFYGNFSYSSGLIRLGAVNFGGLALGRPGPLRATIELIVDEDRPGALPHPR